MALPAGEALDVADDLLSEIRTRLPVAVDLGRACAACVAFRPQLDLVGRTLSVHPLYGAPPEPQICSASTETASQVWPGDPGAQAALTDELLEAIFLRLPTAADLARASVACRTFRRIIADHSFLRRFRALHPPPLLGILLPDFIPAQPPHPSAAAARAFADAGAADFSCSFVRSPDRWRLRDFRDGRALLSIVPEGSKFGTDEYDQLALVRNFAVCDPLHRRYLLLPAIPDDLVALVHQPDIMLFQPFLSPDCEGEGETSFKVICLVECQTRLVVFGYSSGSGQWHASEFDGWSTLIPRLPNPCINPDLSGRYYAHGCFCWAMHWRDKLLVLDTCTMEFSVVNLPYGPLVDDRDIVPHHRAIIEGGDGRLGMLTLCAHLTHGMYYLWYTVLQSDNLGANQWHSEAIIPLPLNYRYDIMGVTGGYLLLLGAPANKYLLPLRKWSNFDWFSLNLKTFQLEWFCGTKDAMFLAQLYAGFPPSFSPPTI